MSTNMFFIEHIKLTQFMSMNIYVYIYILYIGQCTKLICQYDLFHANILSLHRVRKLPGAPRPVILGPLHESAILLLKLLDIRI